MGPRLHSAIAAAALLLAGCSEPAEIDPTEPAKTEPEMRIAKGTGIVTALDAGAGTVTIDHEPMPDIGWSAMTMTFDADTALLAGIAEGDKVAFDLTVTDNRSEVTALAAQ